VPAPAPSLSPVANDLRRGIVGLADVSAVKTHVRGEIPLVWLIGAIGLSLSAVVALMARFSMNVSVGHAGTLILAVIGFAAIVRLRLRGAQPRRQQIWRDASEYYGLFISICVIGALAAYPMSAASSGFVDATLQRIDDAAGFHWLAWYRFVAEHPAIQWPERAAYQTIFLSPAILLGYFAWAGCRAQARLFLATFWLTALVTLVLFAFLPAKGPLAHLWHGPLPYVPVSALYQADLIPALRNHAGSPIDLGALRGLVAAPSFHAASAVLYVFAAWPVKHLRWPFAMMNSAMLLATPVEGTHYLVDLIAGAAVACFVLVSTITVMAKMQRQSTKESKSTCWWTHNIVGLPQRCKASLHLRMTGPGLHLSNVRRKGIK